MRAVLDPNVLVSAQISPEGIPARILEAAEEGRYELVVSERVLEELRGVLMRPKFRRYLPAEAVPAYLERLRSLATHAVEGRIYRISEDPEDDYLIALALASDADYLVSGDPHLLDVQERRRYIKPFIVSPRDFLEDLLRGTGSG